MTDRQITYSPDSPEMYELFIVKVQLPIISPEGYFRGETLVYNEDQSVFQQFPTTSEMVKRMDGDLKRYMWAVIDDKHILQLYDDAPEQDW